MKKIKFIPNLALMVIMFLAGCAEEDIMPFKAEPAVNFVSKSVEYSFLTNPADEYIQEIEVRIIGDTADYERTFNVEVINDSLTTASTNQYEIVGGVVPAGAFTGKLLIKLLKSEQLNTDKVSLHVRLVDSEDFKKGNIEANDFTVAWTNKVVVPAWTYYRFFFTATASTSAYRAIVQSTGVTQFTVRDYAAVGAAGAEALGTQFGDYVKQWNKDHPDNHLKHDDGARAGQDIVPVYYTHSKFD